MFEMRVENGCAMLNCVTGAIRLAHQKSEQPARTIFRLQRFLRERITRSVAGEAHLSGYPIRIHDARYRLSPPRCAARYRRIKPRRGA